MNRNFTSVTKDYVNGQFLQYIIVENGITSIVPLDEANRHYQEILEWVAEGNTITDNGGGE
jgi:hypothetical protein